jgi:hypothetical protein
MHTYQPEETTCYFAVSNKLSSVPKYYVIEAHICNLNENPASCKIKKETKYSFTL